MVDRPPPSRFSVVERGGRLVVIDRETGQTPPTAAERMQALAAAYYPTAGRATGVAWTLGIGRFGGIAGSFFVAELARRHLPLPEVFILVGIPGLVAAAALLIKNRFSPQADAPVSLKPTGAH